MSVLNAAMSGTSVVSMAAAGLLAGPLGVSIAFFIGGAVCLSAGLLGLALYPRQAMARLAPEPAADAAS